MVQPSRSKPVGGASPFLSFDLPSFDARIHPVVIGEIIGREKGFDTAEQCACFALVNVQFAVPDIFEQEPRERSGVLRSKRRPIVVAI